MSDGLDLAIAALAEQMSMSLLAMSQDGATEGLVVHAETLSELVADLLLAVVDPASPPTFAGWAGPLAGVPNFPPDL